MSKIIIQTNNIDEEIKNIDKVIYENIENCKDLDRGFLSQNVLSQLRNFIEHTALKLYCQYQGQELEITYPNIDKAVKFIKSRSKLKFLNDFHRFVQTSRSHYTPTNENAERLMLKYYEYLIKLKKFYKEIYKVDILKNINKFPLNTDKSYYEYYGAIAQKIDTVTTKTEGKFMDGRYYIQKIKPFFINNNIYYEITVSKAIDGNSKYDRITLYSKYDIGSNYAMKISTVKSKVKIFGGDLEIGIINTWEIAIRVCEIKNLYKIFGQKIEFSSSLKEYKDMMKYLNKTGFSLLDLADLETIYYEQIKGEFESTGRTRYIFDLIDRCREFFKEQREGTNVIRYLLYKCNNKIIKWQYCLQKCEGLSDLNLKWGCKPFDEMPFVSALVKHNPKIYDVLNCIETKGREEEFLARYIQMNTEYNGCLYTSKTDLPDFVNVDELVKKYNNRLYQGHQNRKIIIEGNNLFIKTYEENTIEILKRLRDITREGEMGYKEKVEFWLQKENYNIDDEHKKHILQNMFEESKVALIYGAAGTGKSTMIKHISNFCRDDYKIYLAKTHPAVENLKRKVDAPNCEFNTIAKILSDASVNRYCDVLIIDECSTVSNEEMIKILKEVSFRLLILVGDIYQIESITFGNWFNIAKVVIDEKAKHELVKPYRTKNENLKVFWDKVRNLDDDIIECITKNKYSQRLDQSILNKEDSDEIILCLNYDGLYGINNINRFMQNNNKNEAIEWGIGTYKVGDPIIFNDSNRFSPVIYNNLKGKIKHIEVEEHRIWFEIEVNTYIDEIDADSVGLELIETLPNGNSVVKFHVNQFKDWDDDDESTSDAVVPFVVAYAVSIHKSQGLEYNSVKIIITQEIEESISHNIFYTAITRAMEKVKIYWTPECEKRIISTLQPKFNAKDASIIRNKLMKKFK